MGFAYCCLLKYSHLISGSDCIPEQLGHLGGESRKQRKSGFQVWLVKLLDVSWPGEAWAAAGLSPSWLQCSLAMPTSGHCCADDHFFSRKITAIDSWTTQAWAARIYLCVCAQSLSHIWLFVTLWTVAHLALLSMGILQARILKWVAISYSRVSSRPRNWIHISCISWVSCIGRRILYYCATWDPLIWL